MRIFTAAVLTTAYAGNASTLFKRDPAHRGDVALYVDYTKGDETSAELNIETSGVQDTVDSEVYFTPSKADPTTGIVTALPVHQFTATGKYRVSLPSYVDVDRLKLSVKRTGGTGTGLFTLDVI